jgi:hypothetical protein
LDILTLWHNVVFPLPIGIWLGGLLAMVVWLTGRRGGRISANIAATLMGLVAVPVGLFLIFSSGSGAYEWFQYLTFAVIDATVFWLVFMVSIETGFAFLFALLVSWSILSWTSYYLAFAVFAGWPVWIMASMGKGMLSASLPQSSINQLGSVPQDYKKETGIGHVPQW